MLRLAAGALLAGAVLAWPAVARSALGPRYGGEVVIGVTEWPPSLQPGTSRGATASLLAGLVHETLVTVDAGGLPAPGLVPAWTSAAGGREWRLTLPDAAVFHDGRPVTADDALAAVRRFLASDSPAAAWLREGLDRQAPIDVPDPLHLILRFGEPRAAALVPLAAAGAAVVGPRGVGCGPFIPLSPSPGRRYRLTAFGGHVRGRPYLDAVDVALVGSAAALPAEFQAEKIDVFAGEGPLSALASSLILALDPARPPFDRAEARAAVAAAIDRDDIVRRLLPGGDAAPSLLLPDLLPPMVAYAPARGRRLDAAVSMVVGTDVPPLVSQRVVASLGDIGLRVDAVAVPPARVRTAAHGLRLFLWWPEVPEAGLALHELRALAPSAAAPRDALAAADRELDPERRRALLHQAEAALREEGTLIPIASVPVSYRARPGLHGLRLDPSARLVLEDAWREP